MRRMTIVGAAALLVVATGATTAVAKKRPADRKPPTSPKVTGITTSNDPRLVFSAKDNKTSSFDLKFQCSTDGGSYKACRSYGALGLGPGMHALRVITIDKAKNKSKPTAVSLNITATPATTAIAAAASGPGGITSGGGALWLGGPDGIRRIEPASNAIAMHTLGRDLLEVAYGHGSVWTTTFEPGALIRIDPATGQRIASIELANPVGVDADATSVWVAGRRDGTVSRVDPSTNSRSARYLVAESSGPGHVRVGEDGVWVGSQGTPTLARLSPATGALTLRVDSGMCGGIALSGAFAVQVCSGTNGMAVVDRSTGSVRQVAAQCSGQRPLVVGDAVWVPCNGGVGGARLLRVDPAGARVIEEILFTSATDIGSTTAAFDSAWLVTPDAVLRVPLAALTR